MRQRRHSHKNELAYKPDQKRWFLDTTDGEVCSTDKPLAFIEADDWIEVENSEVEYWENPPEGEWEIRKPKRGDIYYGYDGKEWPSGISFKYKYRWCYRLEY